MKHIYYLRAANKVSIKRTIHFSLFGWSSVCVCACRRVKENRVHFQGDLFVWLLLHYRQWHWWHRFNQFLNTQWTLAHIDINGILANNNTNMSKNGNKTNSLIHRCNQMQMDSILNCIRGVVTGHKPHAFLSQTKQMFLSQRNIYTTTNTRTCLCCALKSHLHANKIKSFVSISKLANENIHTNEQSKQNIDSKKSK